jgi:hypothetical protein
MALTTLNLDRIHARGYTDNAADFMVEKLTKLLPGNTQDVFAADCLSLNERRDIDTLNRFRKFGGPGPRCSITGRSTESSLIHIKELKSGACFDCRI